MNDKLAGWIKANYQDAKSDLFSAFIIRNTKLTLPNGQLGFMTPFVWMFIPTYEGLRKFIIDKKGITSLVHLEYSGFEGATVPICTFTLQNFKSERLRGGYVRLSDFRGAKIQGSKTLEAIRNKNCGWFYRASQGNFLKIPGIPIAYWASSDLFALFESGRCLGNIAKPRTGLNTTNNARFLRLWHEVDHANTNFSASTVEDSGIAPETWYPFQKGGTFRKWYGNNEYVVNWRKNGEDIREVTKDCSGGRVLSPEFYFNEGVCWSTITSSDFSARYFSNGFIFSNAAGGIFPDLIDVIDITAVTNSKIPNYLFNFMNPTLNYSSGLIARCPVVDFKIERSPVLAAINVSKSDWDYYETSWDFVNLQLFNPHFCLPTLKFTYKKIRTHWLEMTLEMKRLEEDNNRIFIDAYGLQDELTPHVPLNEITLTCNPYYRYGGDKSDDSLEVFMLTDTMKELISYSIGCMMGRYSLDQPGLIYAHSGNEGFDHSKYTTFPADDDGIVPITDRDWFQDDSTNRFVEFIGKAWPIEHLEENLKFIADSLKPKSGEPPRDTIRRYLSTTFFKDHIKTYKKRPIYWLFSSGKQKAFECLVYLHRYNEATLSRMRMEYVTPLQGRISSRIEQLSGDVASATSTANSKKLNKERDKLLKQQSELSAFDDKLRHLADKRINLDLDDGVKVNYGKFDDLLAEVKAIVGKKK